MVSLSARSFHRLLQATETELFGRKHTKKKRQFLLGTAVFYVLVFEKEEIHAGCYQDELDDHEDRDQNLE